ncbi:MAG: radical SAM/SPASM domain-containing protein [archaeon]
MSLRGRFELFRWNYNAVLSTISSSKEYIAEYVEAESVLKGARRAAFNLGLISNEILHFRNQVIVTDYMYPFLPGLFGRLKKHGMKELGLVYIYPMDMRQKNLSFKFIEKFSDIRMMVKEGQRLGVLTSKPAPGSLLHCIGQVKDETPIIPRISRKENLKRIGSGFKKGNILVSSFPSKLFIEMTRNCNCSCIMCGREKPSYKKEWNMDLRLFKRIADYFFPYADYVDLRGFGESTVIKNIDEYIDHALKYDCDFGIVTNMTVRNDALWKKLALNRFWLGVSFDGAKKKTYEKIRVHGSYENVLHNLKLIQSVTKKRRIESRAYFIVTVQRDNIDELEDIVRLAKKFGVKKVELNPVTSPHEHDSYALYHVTDKIKLNVRAALRAGEELGVEVRLIGTFGLDEKEKETGHRLMKRCPRPWSWLYINYAGLVGSCNHLMDPFFVLGDLSACAGKDEFYKVLNSDKNQFMRAIVHTPYRYKKCEWCFKNRYDY